MAVGTKILINDSKVDQKGTLTLCGCNQINSTGSLVYLTDQTQDYNCLSVPHVGYVTGITSGVLTCLNSCFYNKTEINKYTGDTDNRLTDIESITNVAVTGASNGITKIDSHNIELGGSLTKNTTISGSYGFGVNSNTIKFSGVTSGVEIGGSGLYLTANIPGSGGLLCLGGSGEVCQTSLAAFGGITGGTNGIVDCGNQNVGLGGVLSSSTTICGDGNNLSLGSAGSKLGLLTINSSENIGINSDKNLQISISGGTITTSDGMGLRYSSDYSDTFVDNSLITKRYVDNIVYGIDPKSAVLVATTANIDELIDIKTIDGISLTGGDRILVKDQDDKTENGIYIVNDGNWYRANDFDGTPSGEVTQGALIPVITGNTNANTLWILTSKDPITIDVDELIFTKFSQLIDVSSGNGIDISTVGAVKTISVDLADNSGLCFSSSELTINSSIAGSGLCWKNGVINVDVPTGGTTGVPVKFDDSYDLIVETSAINNVLGGVLSGSTNGLTDNNGIVCLGGQLITSTVICGNDVCGLTYQDTAITNKRGIQYADDYSATFVARSLVDAGFVTGLTSTSGIQTACNGLTKEGNVVVLGGTLTGNTTIDINNGNLLVTDGAGNFGADIATTYVQLGDINGVCGHLYVDDCGSFICMRNATGTTYGEFCFDSTTINGFVSDSIDIGSLNLTKSCYQIDVACGSNVIREQMLASLPEYIVYACGSNKQMFAGALKVPAMACCGAIYATSAGAGVSFGNGSITSIHSTALGNAKVAVGNVMVDVCGESINITTDCVGSTQYIDLDYPTNLITIESTCVNVGLGSTTNILIDGNADSILVNTTGVQLCLQQSGGNIFTDTVNSKGLEYAEDYSINFTDRSLVDKAYVDGAVVSGTSLIYACNGLTKVDNTIALGGTLTGDTWICIPSDACFAFGDATTVNTNIQIIRTSGNESINMYTNGTTFWSDLYLHDGNSALRYYDCNAVTTSELVVEPNRAKMIVNDGNSEIDVDINYIQLGYYGTGNNEIYLDSAGISFLSDTAIILGDASYYNSQVFICAPITSGSTSDQVIVRDSSTGELKTVAGSSLGDKNNIYAMTVITTSTDLTTESTYVQIVNSPSASITVTLPATPIDGQVFRIKDGGNNAVNFPITIAPNGNLIDNAENNATLNTDGGALELVYNNELGSWFVFSFVN